MRLAFVKRQPQHNQVTSICTETASQAKKLLEHTSGQEWLLYTRIVFLIALSAYSLSTLTGSVIWLWRPRRFFFLPWIFHYYSLGFSKAFFVTKHLDCCSTSLRLLIITKERLIILSVILLSKLLIVLWVLRDPMMLINTNALITLIWLYLLHLLCVS